MGRKIPGKKHRTIKDPEKQRANRIKALQNKINNPPRKEDDQEMPKSLLRIMALKEKTKKTVAKRKKRKEKKDDRFSMEKALGKEYIMPGMERPDRFIPVVKQGPKESFSRYLKRVNEACDEVIREVQFEDKYKVNVNRDEDGNIKDISPIKRKKKSKKPSLKQKRKEKERKKKESASVPRDFPGREKIEFGEVAHRPPEIKTLPKKVEKDPRENKPGKRDLLLKNVISNNASSKNSKKKLSALDKHKQEERRKRVVEAFRQMKKLNNK